MNFSSGEIIYVAKKTNDVIDQLVHNEYNLYRVLEFDGDIRYCSKNKIISQDEFDESYIICKAKDIISLLNDKKYIYDTRAKDAQSQLNKKLTEL